MACTGGLPKSPRQQRNVAFANQQADTFGTLQSPEHDADAVSAVQINPAESNATDGRLHAHAGRLAIGWSTPRDGKLQQPEGSQCETSAQSIAATLALRNALSRSLAATGLQTANCKTMAASTTLGRIFGAM